jgi:hypothetical protein
MKYRIIFRCVWLLFAVPNGAALTSQREVCEHCREVRSAFAEFVAFCLNPDWPENSVVKDFLTTAKDGKSYNVKFYNLLFCVS